MNCSTDIQFIGPSWGHHGPYTFFRSFSYRPSIDEEDVRSFAVGQFFFVRILSQLPICVAELQLLWESRKSVGTKLASVKLYFTPDSTPSGRLPHQGQDELLVADEKVVLEVSDLVKWVVDVGSVTWPYGFQMPHPHHPNKKQEEEDVSVAAKGKLPADDDVRSSSHSTRNGFKEHDAVDDTESRRHGDTAIVIVTYAQYCRCRALAKRLEGGTSSWMRNVIVMAMSGLSVARDNARLMFCRETFTHPELMYHDFRRDRLAPKLKGRKRRRKFCRLDSMESVDSDAGGQVAMTTEDDEQLQQQQRTKATVKRFKGLAIPSSGVISSGKDTFQQHLYKFMQERKTPIKRIPSLGFKEVDLFQFFIYSQKFGGYDKVTEGRHWKQIYDQMGGHPGNTSAATCTRRIYEKLLLAFERHVRGEEDKPLPMTYMRPARKKMRELAMVRGRHLTLVSHDRPTMTELLPAPIVDDLCVAMVTGDEKLLEMEAVLPIDDVARTGPEAEAVVPISVKMELGGGGGQSLVTDGQLKISLAVSPPPPPPQTKLKLKVKRGNSPPVIEFKNQSIKDQTVSSSSESNGDLLPLAPPVVQESTPVPKTNSSLMSLSANPANWTLSTGSRLSIDQTPPCIIKGDSLVKTQPLPPGCYPLSFFPSHPLISTMGLEKPRPVDGVTTSSTGVVGVIVTTTAVPSNPSHHIPLTATDQKAVVKDPLTLAPFGFLPPRILLGPPPTPGSARSALLRPMYGPPNVVAPFTPTSNGLLVPIFDPRLPILCRPISTDLQKPLTTRRESSETVASPGKSADPGPARPCPTASSSSSGCWFNSPIKQFLDRTRALTSESRSSDADDQPIDLSVRSTQILSFDSVRDSTTRTRAEQEEPLNLSRKTEPRGSSKTTNLVLPSPSSSKKSGGAAVSAGSGPPGRVVVLPKSTDHMPPMPLILSVPSPINILSTAAAAISNVQSLSVAQGVLTNSAPQGKNVRGPNNGLVSPPTVLSSSPFPTSLVGAAIAPLFQFFPSHPLAYASEAGRPLLLRFPMPVPQPPVTTITHQVPPPPPPSLLASKGNKLN